MANIIKGASVLGCGFNILGQYSVGSILPNNLFKDYPVENQWKGFDVPGNITTIDKTGGDGQSYAFSDRREFSEHFSGSLHASATAGLGSFSGEFSVAYSKDRSEEYQY